MPVPGGIISRTTQLVRGLRNIDAFGFEHIRVGNNPAEIVRAVLEKNPTDSSSASVDSTPPGIPDQEGVPGRSRALAPLSVPDPPPHGRDKKAIEEREPMELLACNIQIPPGRRKSSRAR